MFPERTIIQREVRVNYVNDPSNNKDIILKPKTSENGKNTCTNLSTDGAVPQTGQYS